MQPLKLGVLGAARISQIALYDPARITGTPILAIAARDRARAELVAAEVGIPRVYDTYQEVIDDPDVEAIYNPLPNGLHGPWNLRAIEAGKHVLTEKPFASNAAEALQVHEAAIAAGVHVVEAFHYRYHPLIERMVQIVESGEIGELQAIDAVMVMPAPADTDPRWSFELAGGSMMDIGLYAIHGARQISHLLGGDPEVVSAEGGEVQRHPKTDAWLNAVLEYPNGVRAQITSNMVESAVNFSLRYVGSEGDVFAPAFIQPWLNDEIIITSPSGVRVEHAGPRTTYTYQLEAFTRLIRQGTPMQTDSADAVKHMQYLDRCYEFAGLDLRPITVL